MNTNTENTYIEESGDFSPDYEYNEDTKSVKSNVKFIDSTNQNFPFYQKCTTNVFDIAAYILSKTGSISTMKLQKLVYYSQAWSLVWDESPLFNEKIEAWANGPVVRDLYNFHKGRYTIENIEIGNPDCLNDEQKETINAVLNFYGDRPAQWLIDLTHMEKPWIEARKGLADLERGNREIPLDLIAEYYSSL